MWIGFSSPNLSLAWPSNSVTLCLTPPRWINTDECRLELPSSVVLVVAVVLPCCALRFAARTSRVCVCSVTCNAGICAGALLRFSCVGRAVFRRCQAFLPASLLTSWHVCRSGRVPRVVASLVSPVLQSHFRATVPSFVAIVLWDKKGRRAGRIKSGLYVINTCSVLLGVWGGTPSVVKI